MNQADLIAAAKAAAAGHILDAPLVCAMVEQESDWNQWLNRYEPDFEASPDYGPIVRQHAHDFAATALTKHGYETTWQTEIKNRCTSWGLMQLLGEVARESGFTGPLTSLCDPIQGLELGCSQLAHILKQVENDTVRTLLHWNGGANQQYPNQVMMRMARYR